MAEVEFGGVKFTGGKMVAVLTALSTLGGATWGGFEVYKDYMDMKEIIQNIDIDEIDARNNEIEIKLDAAISYTRDIKNDLKDDIGRIDVGLDKLKAKVEASKIHVESSVEKFEDKTEIAIENFEAKTKAQLREAEQDLKKAQAELEAMADELDAELEKIRDTMGEIRSESGATLRDVETTMRESEKDTRDIMKGTTKDINEAMAALKKDIQERIEEALDNPLND